MMFFVPAAFAQANTGEDCPTLWIAAPLAAVRDGDSAVFAAVVDESINLKNVTFQWTVENGEIAAGQGSNEISVTVSGKPKATVKVGGLAEGCDATVTAEARYGDAASYPILFDEFGKVKDKLLQRRVAALLGTIRRNPDSKGYLVSYGSPKDVENREQDIRRFAVGAEASTLVFITAGTEKEIRTRVWIIPRGAEAKDLN